MKIKATGADPLFICAALYMAVNSSLWWTVVIPLIVLGWVIHPRWDSENGWRFFHE